MKLRVTSITSSDVGPLISAVTTVMEDKLRPVLEQREYGGGVQQLAVFFVSVDCDPIGNQRYCVANNRVGRYKDLMTGKMVKFLGISVPVDPNHVLDSQREALLGTLQKLLLEQLEAPAFALPKGFDLGRLVDDVKAGLSPA